jgi:hypothetical protein
VADFANLAILRKRVFLALVMIQILVGLRSAKPA